MSRILLFLLNFSISNEIFDTFPIEELTPEDQRRSIKIFFDKIGNAFFLARILSKKNELFLSDTNENHYLTVEELTIWLEKIDQIERAKYAWKRRKSLKR